MGIMSPYFATKVTNKNMLIRVRYVSRTKIALHIRCILIFAYFLSVANCIN